MSAAEVAEDDAYERTRGLTELFQFARLKLRAVRAGELRFTAAVSQSHAEAIRTGLYDSAGERTVDFVLAQAFGAIPGELCAELGGIRTISDGY